MGGCPDTLRRVWPRPRYQRSHGCEPERGGPCWEAVLHVRVASPAAAVPPYGLVFPCRWEEGLPTENMDVTSSGVCSPPLPRAGGGPCAQMRTAAALCRIADRTPGRAPVGAERRVPHVGAPMHTPTVVPVPNALLSPVRWLPDKSKPRKP